MRFLLVEVREYIEIPEKLETLKNLLETCYECAKMVVMNYKRVCARETVRSLVQHQAIIHNMSVALASTHTRDIEREQQCSRRCCYLRRWTVLLI